MTDGRAQRTSGVRFEVVGRVEAVEPAGPGRGRVRVSYADLAASAWHVVGLLEGP